MKVTKNALPMLYTAGIVAGLSTIIGLSDVPQPICDVERNESGTPINVVGRISLNKTARMTALMSALLMIGGYGTLAVKSIRGEELDEVETTQKSLTPGTQSVVDFTPQPEMEYVSAVIQQPLSIDLTKTTMATTTTKTGKPTRDIIQELASSHQSTVIVSEPGCGKSTLEKAVLARLLETFKNVDIYIAGKKNDSWLGLSGNKDRFCFVTKDSLPEFVEMMEEVQNELTRRLGIPEESRDFNKQPLVLLLDDWHALCKGLTKESKEKVTQILGEILTTGREVFVVAHVITQSFNVQALGLDDANIRGSMNLIALLKSNTNDNGRNDGGVGTATRMINNPSIVGDNNQRQEMINQLGKYIKETESTGIPAMVCLMGVKPFIGMLPDLNWVKRITPLQAPAPVPQQPEIVADGNPIEINYDKSEAVQRLNKALSLESQPPAVAEVEDEVEDVTLDQLSDKELHIKCQRYASQGHSLYSVITNIFRKPSSGRAFTEVQKRIEATEAQFGKIDFPNRK